MGQFSVEICHLVGQFSMKLNTPGFAILRRRCGPALRSGFWAAPPAVW